MSHKQLTADSPLKEHELSAVVTVGPITAAKLGVPVGTKIDLGVIAYYHRFPPVRLLFGGKAARKQWREELAKWREARKPRPKHVLNP